MATVKVVAIKDARNKEYGYLNLRTTKNRQHSYKSLKEKVKLTNWNQGKQTVYAKEPKADQINEKIAAVLKASNNGKTSTILNKDKSLLTFANKLIQSVNNTNTKRGKKRALKKLKEYLSTIEKEDLLISEVEPFFIKGYYNYMLKELTITTANEYFTILKWFVNQAIQHRLHSFEYDPFKGFKKKKSNKTYEVLSSEELDKLLHHSFSHTYKHHVQHAFKFMLFSNGMRISDFLNLTWDNFNEIDGKYYIKFRVKKTSQEHTTQLNLHSLRSLLPYLRLYKDVNLNMYSLTLTTKKRALEYLQEAENEYNDIKVKGFREVFSEFEIVSNMWKIKEIVKEQSKLEMKKITLKSKIKALEKNLESYEKDMQDLLFKEIKTLQSNNKGQLRVFPKLNEFEKKEVEEQTDRMATKFNYYLGQMAKELNIKTKLSSHQARHIFAQRLFESGENFHHISLALGHSSLEVTENYRQKLVTDKAKDVTNSFIATFNQNSAKDYYYKK